MMFDHHALAFVSAINFVALAGSEAAPAEAIWFWVGGHLR
jgi:hypothetical protein